MFFVSIEILILKEKKCEIKNKFDSNFNACKTKDIAMDQNILYCYCGHFELRSRQTDYCNVFKDLPKLTICRLITLDFVRVS